MSICQDKRGMTGEWEVFLLLPEDPCDPLLRNSNIFTQKGSRPASFLLVLSLISKFSSAGTESLLLQIGKKIISPVGTFYLLPSSFISFLSPHRLRTMGDIMKSADEGRILYLPTTSKSRSNQSDLGGRNRRTHSLITPRQPGANGE